MPRGGECRRTRQAALSLRSPALSRVPRLLRQRRSGCAAARRRLTPPAAFALQYYICRVDAPPGVEVPGGSYVTVESGPHHGLPHALHALQHPKPRVSASPCCDCCSRRRHGRCSTKQQPSCPPTPPPHAAGTCASRHSLLAAGHPGVCAERGGASQAASCGHGGGGAGGEGGQQVRTAARSAAACLDLAWLLDCGGAGPCSLAWLVAAAAPGCAPALALTTWGMHCTSTACLLCCAVQGWWCGQGSRASSRGHPRSKVWCRWAAGGQCRDRQARPSQRTPAAAGGGGGSVACVARRPPACDLAGCLGAAAAVAAAAAGSAAPAPVARLNGRCAVAVSPTAEP